MKLTLMGIWELEANQQLLVLSSIDDDNSRNNVAYSSNSLLLLYTYTLLEWALDVDFSLVVGGDMAYIGEKRVNLSGGQRACLALARAVVYHGSNVIMLDNVPSAVDVQVAQWILHNAINHRQPFNTNSSLKSKEQPLQDKVIRHAQEEPKEVIEVELRKEGKVELGSSV
ncbi:hypothetical protein RIF29_00166 [Crotalaria pallida]|uniref:ABC transporter domain-containing protein n=1 Tax=Crotalaria pallida TaxID=3830 RepID=A0AAN9IVX5_CROPI